jgi:hypothetical protein
MLEFRQNSFKQEVEYYGLTSMNVFILLGVRNNSPIRGRNALLYRFTRRATKLSAVIPKLLNF